MATTEVKDLLDLGTDAFGILRNDHEKVGKIIEELEKAHLDEKEGLFAQLDTEIIRHAELEERYFYPKLQDYEELAELVQDALADHDDMREILLKMESQEVGSEKWLTNCDALECTLDDHAEMEEREIFTRAMELLSEDELNQMQDRIIAEKQKVPLTHRHRDRPPRAGV